MTDPLTLRLGLAFCPTGKMWRRPWVSLRDGTIGAIGEDAPPSDVAVSEHPEWILLPGFVKAHTHLLPTALGGKLSPTTDFWQWIFDLIAGLGELDEAAQRRSVEEGMARSLAAGTTTLLDSAHPMAPVVSSPLRALRAGELFAATEDEPLPALEPGALLAPHTVYTTTARLLAAVGEHVREHGGLLTIHLSETEDENALWRTGESAGLRRLFEHFGFDRTGWECPRCSPTAYLARLGALGPRTLLVHGNHLSDQDIAMIAEARAPLCFCPASHRFFGHPPHPLPRLLAAGVRVCLGTDSLASAPSLSMWDQARLVAGDHPDLAWPALLAMITSEAAAALGLGADFATLRPGAPADLVLARSSVPLEAAAAQPRLLFEGEITVEKVLFGGRQVSSTAT